MSTQTPAPRRRLRIAALSLALLVALEGALWLLAPAEDFLAGRGPTYHRYLPGWNYYGQPPTETTPHYGELNGVEPATAPVPINRYGFLYPEEDFRRSSPREIRIAVLGGSTVECIALRPENRWPAVLEELLQDEFPDREVTVLNLGISHNATWAHLAEMGQHVVDLDVDVAVFLEGGNDLVRSRPGFQNLLTENMFGANPQLTPGLFARWIATRFQIGRWGRKAYHALRMGTGPQSYFRGTVKLLKRAPVLPFVPEFTPEALDGYERQLVSISAIGEAHGMEVFFATQPTLWREDNREEERDVFWILRYNHDGRTYKLDPKDAKGLLEILNQRLMSTCARHGYGCIDLAAAVPPSLDYFYDDMHFNDRGAHLVAKEVQKAIGPSLHQLP